MFSVSKENKTFEEKIEALGIERLDCIEGQVVAHTKAGSLIEFGEGENRITGFSYHYLPLKTQALVTIRKIIPETQRVILLLDSVIQQGWEVA